MITCGEALERVHMAMAEAGFPDAWLRPSRDASLPFRPPGDGVRLHFFSPLSEAEYRAYYRAVALTSMSVGIDMSRFPCEECFIADFSAGRCEHTAAMA